MPNVTLSIPEDLLKLSRAYAKKHHISLSALVCMLLREALEKDKRQLTGP